jgi:acetyl esterase/lipase
MIKEKIQLWSEWEDVYLSYCKSPESEEKDNKKSPAVIVCPGGGYLRTADKEAEPVAYKFAKNGFKAFVLRYSTNWTGHSEFPQPLFDLAKAILILRKNADEWGIDSNKVVLCGFSAGGHLVASMSTSWNKEFILEKFKSEGITDNEIFKPNNVILGYPVVDQSYSAEEWTQTDANGNVIDLRALANKTIYGKEQPSEEEQYNMSPVNFVSQNTPPTFIWHTFEDDMVDVKGSVEYGAELTKNKVPFELHIFEKGPHALSVCDESTTNDPGQLKLTARAWFELALNWLFNSWDNN